jgi:O-antigen/teichoic acid export membrane protein
VILRRTIKTQSAKADDSLARAPDTKALRKTWRRRMTSYSRPLALWGAFEWAHFSSDRWLLGLFGSTEQVGLYAVLFQIAWYPIALVLEALVQFVRPAIFASSGLGSNPEGLVRGKRLVDVLVFGTVVFTVAVALIATQLGDAMVTILASPDYREISGPLPLMLLASGLFAASRAAAVGLGALEETKRLVLPKVFCSIVSVVLTALGAWRYGVTGVVMANLCYAVLLLIWTYCLMRRSYSRRLGRSAGNTATALGRLSAERF